MSKYQKIQNHQSHNFGWYLGERRCLRCKCPEKGKESYRIACPKKELICSIKEWENYRDGIFTSKQSIELILDTLKRNSRQIVKV